MRFTGSMTPRRPRVAIAVEPTILGDALTEVLTSVGVDEVVNLRAEPSPPVPESFDAAVVTIVLPDNVNADVVIELPGTPTGHGDTNVRVEGRTARVAVRAVEDILRLLDDYCPGEEPRRGSTPEGD